MRRLLMLAALVAAPASAQEAREPIIDMLLHARAARYAGDHPPPMCTPFQIMPRSDPEKGVYEGMTFDVEPCDSPVPAATSDDQVLHDTIAAMERFNIFGVISGEPAMVERWLLTMRLSRRCRGECHPRSCRGIPACLPPGGRCRPPSRPGI